MVDAKTRPRKGGRRGLSEPVTKLSFTADSDRHNAAERLSCLVSVLRDLALLRLDGELL